MDNDWTKKLKIKKLRGRPPKIKKLVLYPSQLAFLKKWGMVTVPGYLLTIEGHGLLAKE